MDIGKKPLVSVVIAFFNEEKYIEECLLSLLNQTYSNLEVIAVDDGSKDTSAKIVKSYVEAFEKRNMKLIYVFQENQGQASATNKALKFVKGKYLCWIDGDDFLYERAIEKRVLFLEDNPTFGMVTGDIHVLDEESGCKELRGKLYGNLNYQTNQFELMLSGESLMENLAHMINLELFRKINPKMEIVESRQGQNYQILLPTLFYFKRGFINEPLGVYRIHSDSHYHRERSFEERLERLNQLIEMLKEILVSLNIREEEIEHLVRKSTFFMERGRLLDGRAV